MKIDPTAALGPDSLAWKYAGDNLQFFLGGTILVLQVAHPVVGAGVGEHSVYKTDPWGRLERTTAYATRLLYGGPAEAERASRELLALHANIKGVDDKGRRYAALNPEAYAWVHLTSYYAMVATQDIFGVPLTAQQKSRLYAEWRQHGRVLGIAEVNMPGDLAAFDDYFRAMIEDRLEFNSVVQDLLTPDNAVPKPNALRRLPDELWKGLYGYADHWSKISTRATLPPLLAEKLGVVLSSRDHTRFQAMKTLVRRTHRFVPARLRYLPAAYGAMKEAGVLPQSEWRGLPPLARRLSAP